MGEIREEALDRWERHKSEETTKRGNITKAGLDFRKLEMEYNRYVSSSAHLSSVPYHQKVVNEYRASTEPKWEDF